MSFLELAKDRYSMRKFSDKPVEQDKLDLILEAGRIAPTAHNSQPQRILVLNTPAEMELLAKCCPFRFHQTLALVVCYEKEVRREFHIPEALVPMAILMMGYPNEEAKPSRLHNDRLELSKTVFYHTFQG